MINLYWGSHLISLYCSCCCMISDVIICLCPPCTVIFCPYRTLHCAAVYAFLIQLLIVTAGIIGYGFEKNDSSFVVTGYITSILMSFVLLGILQMYDMLSNPVSILECYMYRIGASVACYAVCLPYTYTNGL